jgi:hypothetical protein
VMSIAIRNVPTYRKLHFSNFLIGIYSKDAWLMAEGISPSLLETWSRTWFALNDKIAHICLLIARLNKLGSSSWFIVVIHQSSQCDAYLRGMICSDCNWHLRCTDPCCDNLLHVRPALIWSIRGSSDLLLHAADQAKTLCWIRATFGMSCFLLAHVVVKSLQAWNIVLCLGWSFFTHISNLAFQVLPNSMTPLSLIYSHLISLLVATLCTTTQDAHQGVEKNCSLLSFFHLPKLFRV